MCLYYQGTFPANCIFALVLSLTSFRLRLPHQWQLDLAPEVEYEFLVDASLLVYKVFGTCGDDVNGSQLRLRLVSTGGFEILSGEARVWVNLYSN